MSRAVAQEEAGVLAASAAPQPLPDSPHPPPRRHKDSAALTSQLLLAILPGPSKPQTGHGGCPSGGGSRPDRDKESVLTWTLISIASETQPLTQARPPRGASPGLLLHVALSPGPCLSALLPSCLSGEASAFASPPGASYQGNAAQRCSGERLQRIKCFQKRWGGRGRRKAPARIPPGREGGGGRAGWDPGESGRGAALGARRAETGPGPWGRTGPPNPPPDLCLVPPPTQLLTLALFSPVCLSVWAPRSRQRPSCSYALCTVLLSLAVLLAVAVTSVVLFLNHIHVPGTAPPPVVSTGPAGVNGALVTVERADSSRLSILIDPRCPDLADGFARLEGAQASVLRALAEHRAQPPPDGTQERELLDTIADQLARLLARASELQAECAGLRKGHGTLGQGLSTLQSEQGRLIQLLSESQGHMAHLVTSVGDILDVLQRDRGLGRPRLKADIQRAPSRGIRPRGCANGSRPRDCLDVLLSGQQDDGVYSVFPTHYPAGFQVYCDMRTDGGGWTVFQRREDGSVNFFRGWDAYREGFGKLTGEHWLGLKRIHALTTQAAYELHVDLEDFDNGTAFARYGSFGVGLFSVDPEEDGYPLTVAEYSGTAGDSLLKHSGMRFTTKDRDGDHSDNNCAAFYRGAWWYRNCHTSNLNGQYLRGAHASYADGVEWSSWTGWQYSLKFSEMKIRPVREDR
uniref:Fibrinogen C domain containing 1 n=1 Tax=Cavia porcellus TaxID=10141 RepID=H0V7A7_CAVPO